MTPKQALIDNGWLPATADKLIAHLAAAGYVIVPREPAISGERLQRERDSLELELTQMAERSERLRKADEWMRLTLPEYEAEIERLRAALGKLANMEPKGWVTETARRALEEK